MTMIYHPIKDQRIKARNFQSKINPTFDKNGDAYNQAYVEFTVIGKRTEYQDFMLLEDFKKHNPKVKFK